MRKTAAASLFIMAAAISPNPCRAVDPITVAASGATVGFVIDKFSEKINETIDKTTANGSLLANKAARDLQLAIEAARQQFNDELNTQWDKLDQQKLSIIREIDKQVENISLGIKQTQNIEDTAYLDIDGLLSSLPFSKDVPSVRRIDGATQIYKFSDGLYRVVIKGNIFDASRKLSIMKRDLKDPDTWSQVPASWSLIQKPPYEMAMEIPAAEIEGLFKDSSLSKLELRIDVDVANRRWFEIWKESTRRAKFPITLELFPKLPLRYKMIEYRSAKKIDDTTLLIQKGALNFVGGCGNSGCNSYFNFCTDVPAGSQPVATVNPYDSFNGWGAWGAFAKSSTGFCGVYWQHSHNVGRNVSFDVTYHPLVPTTIKHPVYFERISTEPNAPINNLPPGNCKLNILNAIINVPCGATSAANGTLAYGATYSVQFSPDMVSFDLAIKSFTGDETVITPGLSSNLFNVSAIENQSSFKRITVKPLVPW